MDLHISGTVIDILEEQSGTGKNGPWRKQDFILQTKDQYPKKICITQWGDKIDEFGVQKSEDLTVYIDIQSREYNGRWYTDVKAWKVERGGGNQAQPAPQQSAPADADPFQLNDDFDESDDGLPF